MNRLKIDLGTFSFEGTAVGDATLGTGLDRDGIKLGTDDNRLNSIFVTLDEFTGQILRSGATVPFSTSTTPREIEELFGEPYWRDLDDGELILFYEYQFGAVEVQFEFPDSTNLGFITIANNGVLSDPEQRSSYGVDKPWPPTNN